MAIAAQAEQEAIRRVTRTIGDFMTLAYPISGAATLSCRSFTYHLLLCGVNPYNFYSNGIYPAVLPPDSIVSSGSKSLQETLDLIAICHEMFPWRRVFPVDISSPGRYAMHYALTYISPLVLAGLRSICHPRASSVMPVLGQTRSNAAQRDTVTRWNLEISCSIPTGCPSQGACQLASFS